MDYKESSPYALVIFLRSALENHGESLQEILDRSGKQRQLLDEQYDFISYAELEDIWRIASEAVSVPAIGFWLALNFNVEEDFGFTYSYFVNTGDLKAMLEAYSEGSKKMNQGYHNGIKSVKEGQWSFFHVTKNAENWFHRQYSESFTAVTVRLLRTITNEELLPDEIRFQFGPAGSVEEYENFFGCPVKFNQPVSEIIFPDEWMQAPTIGNQLITASHLKKISDQLLPEMQGENLSWQKVVMQKIIQAFGKQKISLSMISSEVGLNGEQLKYALSKEGHVFSKILEDARKQEALNKLTSTDWSISEISSYLGYSESSSFTRNFHQWFGQSPSQYRKTGS